MIGPIYYCSQCCVNGSVCKLPLLFIVGFDTNDEYLTEMEKDSTWGDGIILSTAYHCYQRPVKILYADTDKNNTQPEDITIGTEEDGHVTPIYLGFLDVTLGTTCSSNTVGVPNHYVSLVPVVEKQHSTSLGTFSLYFFSPS